MENVYKLISSKMDKEIAVTDLIQIVHNGINEYKYITNNKEYYLKLSDQEKYRHEQLLTDLEDTIYEKICDYFDNKELRELRQDER